MLPCRKHLTDRNSVNRYDRGSVSSVRIEDLVDHAIEHASNKADFGFGDRQVGIEVGDHLWAPPSSGSRLRFPCRAPLASGSSTRPSARPAEIIGAVVGHAAG